MKPQAAPFYRKKFQSYHKFRVVNNKRDFFKTNLEKKWKLIAFILLLLIILLSFVYLSSLFFQVRDSFPSGSKLGLISLVSAMLTRLKGENEGRTNILIFGLTADEARTDSILLISYFWKEKKIVALNIPRDLYINYKNYKGKIVSLYEIEKNNHPTDKNLPPEVVSNFIASEFNIPIHYYFVTNFAALKEIVDILGGITVTVDHSFSDSFYPDERFGYLRPIPEFKAGVQQLNGTQALIFSRSRQSQDQPLEGTDFARSLRQEKVLQAIISKLKSQSLLTNLSHLDGYLRIFGKDVYTNMNPEEITHFLFTLNRLNLSKDFLKANWSNNIGFFCDSQADGQYVLKYGNLGNCQAIAGINDHSLFRQKALDFVQNLLSNGSI